jgi:two-component system, NtrC family, nitrogen regulation sensor histidine kinase GlnL
MSARNDHKPPASEAGLNLVGCLQSCFAPGIIVINQSEEIVSLSPEAEQLLGSEKLHPIETSAHALPAILRQAIREVVRRGPGATVEFNLPGVLQTSRKLRIQALLLPPGPTDSLTVLTLTDLSGIVRLQQSLERLDRLATAGTLAAGMAHEIKNALVAVKTFLDLLLEQNKDSELAELVGREMTRVNSIIRQLLKFGGSRQPVREPVRVHDVLEHSLRMVQHQLRDKLISLNRAFKAPLDTVHGDNHQLEQVFVNLFLNAVDATGPNGSLTVQTELLAAGNPGAAASGRSSQPHVRITVADTGVGITPEHLAQLFQPFFTTKAHGTGLGLPITRRIVEEHQGLITVTSQPNQGTTISVILPAGPPSS